jgi:hypothetical protein
MLACKKKQTLTGLLKFPKPSHLFFQHPTAIKHHQTQINSTTLIVKLLKWHWSKDPGFWFSKNSDDESRRFSFQQNKESKLLCMYYSSLNLYENVAKRWCHQINGDEILSFAQL